MGAAASRLGEGEVRAEATRARQARGSMQTVARRERRPRSVRVRQVLASPWVRTAGAGAPKVSARIESSEG